MGFEELKFLKQNLEDTLPQPLLYHQDIIRFFKTECAILFYLLAIDIVRFSLPKISAVILINNCDNQKPDSNEHDALLCLRPKHYEHFVTIIFTLDTAFPERPRTESV